MHGRQRAPQQSRIPGRSRSLCFRSPGKTTPPRRGRLIDLPAKYALESHLVRIPYQSATQIAYYFIWNRANDNESFARLCAFVDEKIAALQD